VNEKLKIGYLVPQFPGQTHIFFWRELQELEKQGVDVQVISTRLPPAGLISHQWSKDAIARTLYLGRPRIGDFLAGLLQLPYGELLTAVRTDGREMIKDILICAGAARHLLHETRARGISHVHAHSCGRAALICALANRMGGLSYSVTLHGPLQDYGVGQPFKWRHASYATIITKKLLAEVQATLGPDLPKRVLVQPMGVDTERFCPTQPYQAPTPNAPLRLFSCGRLNRVKGHQDLMQAVALLTEKGLNVQLEIAGEDDTGGHGYHQILAAQIVELGLQNHVHLLGAIDADAVRDKLRTAHIFVLASWAEPLGVAYMEAMACGIPTIGTDAGGVPELIENNVSGVLVPPQNPQRLADKIAEIASNPDFAQSLGQNGRNRVVQHFRSTLGAELLARESRLQL
jgi:glycosyltransferase involved in cell wall biosynthesis